MQPDAAALCEQLRGPLVGALFLYVGERAVAEDLAQEALVRTVERWSQVATLDRPAAWVWRVAFNLARSGFRRRVAERRALSRLGGLASGTDDRDSADAVAVRRAVTALPPRQRAVVVARFYADLSVAQTAVVLGCAEGTVKSLTHHAVTALRGAGLGVESEGVITDA